MSVLIQCAVFTACASLGLAQDSNPTATIEQLARSADQQLAESVHALDLLRDQVSTEKLPLAEALSASETRLSELRKAFDDKTRSAESQNLEIAGIKAELKSRRDELDYVGNLLDEYARNFETKVHFSELQAFGAPIESAKGATENTALPLTERFERQITLVELSLRRAFEIVGGRRFDGLGVDGQGNVAEGRYALIGPVALFAANSGVAGLAVQQAGSTKPLIRPLEGAMQTGLAALVQTGDGTLPLDPSMGGALKALVQKTSLWHIFEKGGPIMWPLLIASILALGTVLERVFFLLNEKRKRNPRALEQFFEQVGRGQLEAAIATSRATKDFVLRALGYALEHKEKSLASALLYAQSRELKRFRRGIPILDTVITVAPLLGLLGTVTGMMGSFSLIGGDLSAPGAITGGIAEALIATAFGLGIAITSLLPFNVLNTKLDEARHEIESASTQLELMMHPPASTIAAVAHATHPQDPESGIGILVPRQRVETQPDSSPRAAASGAHS